MGGKAAGGGAAMTDQITPSDHSNLVGGSTASRRIGAGDLSPEEVRRFLHYDPATGRFWYKIRAYDSFNGTAFIKKRNGMAWNQRCAGRRACSSKSGAGYYTGRIMGVSFGAHRLAWLHYHGTAIPEGMFVDHINGDGFDNRIENLRLATPRQSVFNTSVQRNSTSKVKGVSWDKKNQKWKVRIKCEAGEVWLGRFDSLEAARGAYEGAAEKYHGDYAHHTSRGNLT
jgi:hypothetical protein